MIVSKKIMKVQVKSILKQLSGKIVPNEELDSVTRDIHPNLVLSSKVKNILNHILYTLSNHDDMIAKLDGDLKIHANAEIAKADRYSKKRIGRKPIFSINPIEKAALLEYIAAELIELAGYCTNTRQSTKIKVKDLVSAIDTDPELKQTLINIK